MAKLKIAVIGSGSTYTPELISGFLDRKDTLKIGSIYMMDIDAHKNMILSGLARRMIEAKGLDIKLVISDCLEETISGADYIISQLRVGKLPARVLDEKIPLKYDLIGQETTGTGGFFKALRTIPVMMEIAKLIEKHAPDAWLINFSNPSGIIAQMLSDHTKINFAGLCNEPINIERLLRKKLPEGASFDFDFVGLNHLNWVTKVVSDGKDVLNNFLTDENVIARSALKDSSVLKIIKAIPSGYLRYYYDRDISLEKCKNLPRTRGEECMEIENNLLEIYKDANLNEKPALLEKRGGALYSEAACSLVESIENNSGAVHVVNVNHKGTLPFLNKNDVAEVKCRVTKNGMEPLPLLDENINEHIVGLVRAIKSYEKLTIKASVEKCYNSGLEALMTHPLIIDCSKAKAVYDELLEAHKDYISF